MRNLTADQLADELELFPKTLKAYAKRGCPHDAPKKHGEPYLFDRGEVVAWMKANEITGNVGRPAPTGTIGEKVKLAQIRVLTAKGEKAELELQQLRGSLVSRDEAERDRVECATYFRNSLLGLPASLSPQLAGLSAPEIHTKLEAEFRRLLERLAKE